MPNNTIGNAASRLIGMERVNNREQYNRSEKCLIKSLRTYKRLPSLPVKMQQEMFQKWIEGISDSESSMMPSPGRTSSDWRKQWEQASPICSSVRRSWWTRTTKRASKPLEESPRVAEAKSPHEYQKKVTELYRKSFESLRQLSEAQMNEFKSASEKLSKLMTGSSVG